MTALLSILGIAFGILILKYTPQIYGFFGQDQDAERVFGSGGTYKFLKLFGLACVVVGLLYLFGIL